jgi:hypothetical protein
LVQFLSESQYKVLVNEFEAFHGIPHIIGVADGSHIPILTLVIGGEDYVIKKKIIQLCYKVLLT